MELLILFVLLAILAVVAQFWGADNRDGVDNQEWARRKDHPLHRH